MSERFSVDFYFLLSDLLFPARRHGVPVLWYMLEFRFHAILTLRCTVLLLYADAPMDVCAGRTARTLSLATTSKVIPLRDELRLNGRIIESHRSAP